MMFKIECFSQKAQPVLSIRTRTTMENLPKLIGESYMKIMAYLTELGQEPIDAPFTAYHNLDMQNLDTEMGFAVPKLFAGKGDIQAREVPESLFVSCLYKGPYSGMEEPYNKIFAWIAEHGYKQSGVYFEYYYNSPADVPEKELLTRIMIPVA